MHSLFTIAALALSVSLGASAQTAAPSTPAQLVASLKDAPTANDRLNLLKDTDFVFNFLNATATKGAGGNTIGANVANFPVLTNQGLAMTVGNLDACGMNTPHTHPRATEMLYLVNGTLQTGMLDENGARFVYNTINNGSAAVFLKGSIHYQLNWGCEPVQFVAVLNHEDPGTLSVAQRYLGLPPDIVSASLGDFGVQEIEALAGQIPDNIALGTAECLQRCGITSGTQPTSQLQPRISANAFPSAASASASPSATAHSRRDIVSDESVFSALFGAMGAAAHPLSAPSTADSDEHVTIPQAEARVIVTSGSSNALNFALVGLVALMATGYVAIALVYARSRGRAAQYAAALPVVAHRYPAEKFVAL